MALDDHSWVGYNQGRRTTHMLTAVRGIYRDGQIELEELPVGVGESRVIVTFLEAPAQATAKGTPIRYGMFPQLQALTDEDFRMAEWRGDDEEAAE